MSISAQSVDLNLMMSNENKIGWNLTDLKNVPQNGLKVFSTFACGGGSSMGYKLAGFDVIGANDIDPQMRQHYEANLKPKFFIESPIIDLLRDDLPAELFDLDVLDGSPPCSTFSLAGSREKAWGREKHFREGQAIQILDDLFFDFLKVADHLRPKVIIAENVKGMLAGNARGYVSAIFNLLKVMGYVPQIFLVNAGYCGVPQTRERVFVCAIREDLFKNKLELNPTQTPISLTEAFADLTIEESDKYYPSKDSQFYKYWSNTPINSSLALAYKKDTGRTGWFGHIKHAPNLPAKTICSAGTYNHWSEPRGFTKQELIRCGSFPDDYQFFGKKIAQYLIGMSVPPKMMQFVASNVRDQWLS